MKKAALFVGGWEGHTPEAFCDWATDLLESEGFEVVSFGIDVPGDHSRHTLSQHTLGPDGVEDSIGASCSRGVFMGSVPAVDVVVGELSTRSQAELGELDAASVNDVR